jgi:hypothetical protein
MDVAPMPPAELEPSQKYSLAGMLIDVCAAPGDVFDYLKMVPTRTMTWLVPLVLVSVMTVFYVVVAYSQPGVLAAARDAQEKAFDKKVAAGQMTRDQADKIEKISSQYMTPSILRAAGAVGGVLATFAAFFLTALILWLAARIVHNSTVAYMKIAEVVALAGIISVLNIAVKCVLVIWKGSLMATLSPVLFLDDASATHRPGAWLSLLDPVEIWWLAVLSLGFSKVAPISYAKAALWVFGVWYAFRAGLMLLTPSS